MTPPAEALALVGSFGRREYPALEHSGPDTVFLNDWARLQIQGDWRPEELRVVRGRLGTVAFYGSCVASEQTIAHVASEALESDRLETLTALPGSYTTLVCRRNELAVCADLAGQFPFYYRANGNGMDFGLQAQPLQASVCRPDGLTLAAGIAVGVPGDITAGRSAIADVQRLEGGHRLDIRLGGNVRVSPYETFGVPTVFDLQEAANSLRSALLDAVRLRVALGRRMSADFSGGLDSTSAAYLLARQLADPLVVVTKHSGDVPSDDLRCARTYLALAESRGLFNGQEFERPAGMTTYANLLAAAAGDMPDQSILTRATNEAYCRFLRGHGSELHVTGSGADALFDMAPSGYLGGLAKPGTYGRFIRSVLETARGEYASPLLMLDEVWKQRQLNPVHKLRAMSRILQGGQPPEALRYGRDQIFGPGAMPEWLTKDARRDLSALAAARANELQIDPDCDMGNYHAYAELRNLGPNLYGGAQYAASLGMRKHAMYLDNDVLRACFGLPSYVRVNPWVFKQLLVRAVDGLVPREVTSRTTKGDYSRHGIEGLRTAHGMLASLVRNSWLADLGVIDPRSVQKTMDSVAMGANPPWVALDRFISAELWLRSLDGQRVQNALSRDWPLEIFKPAETPIADDARYGMPPGIFMATRSTGAIAINLPSGTHHRFNSDAVRVLEALRDTATFGEALSVLEGVYPGASRAKLGDAASRLIRQLAAEGILTEGATTFSIVTGSNENGYESSVAMTRQSNETTKARLRDYPAAVGGLVIATLMLRLPFEQQVRMLRGISEHWCRKPASEGGVTSLLAAVHRLSAPHLGRVACVEKSTATVLAAALRRRRVTLALGVKSDPDRFHAWPEVNGTPIRIAGDPEIEGIFMPIFKV